jgi:hypothetical protein
MKTTLKSLLTVAALSATSVVLYGQDAPKPATPNATTPERRGGEDRRGNYEDFRKRMSERLKTSLKVTDDEWSVIEPLIEKVNEKQREAGGSRFGGGTRGGGGTPGGTTGGTTGTTSTRPERPGSAESAALRTALESDTTSPEEIKAKLTALREVRKKGASELVVAREELRKVVTVRQEAVLVSMGILE